MKISCFTVMQGKLPLNEVIPNVAKAGYDGLELQGLAHVPPETSDERASEIKSICDKNGIAVMAIAGYHGAYNQKTNDDERNQQLEYVKNHCRIANILGCDILRHSPGGPPSYKATDAEWKSATEWMKKACDIAAEYNVRLAMEIHNGGLVESSDDAMKIIEMTGRDNLGAIHDGSNMYISGVDFGLESFKKLGDRLFHVHIKGEKRIDDEALPNSFWCDTREGRKLFQATLLEDDLAGTDHRIVLRALKEIDYKGYISLECHVFGDDPTIPEKEITSLRKMFAEVGIE